MGYGLSQTQAPAGYPVSNQEVKDRLRIHATVGTADDNMITEQIADAVELCESRMDRQIMPAEWTLYLDAFPDVIRLPRPPLISVTSVRYLDTAGAWQTLAATGYTVRSGREPVEIVLAYGQSWPGVLFHADVIEIKYQAGYADASSVPQAIKQAIYYSVALARGDCVQLGMTDVQCRQRRDEILMRHWHGWAFG